MKYSVAKQGFYKQLMKSYSDAGWVRKLGKQGGAYIKLGDPLGWAGAVAAIESQLDHPAHVGGLSALELHGLAQYVAVKDAWRRSFSLFNTTAQKKPLPKWFQETFPDATYFQPYLFAKEKGLIKKQIGEVEVFVSTPERAILEVLSLVPHSFDYTHACELSENLQLLNPKLMQTLLKSCRSVKVKRLFLYLADTYRLPCFDLLNLSGFELGSGKRVISPGGHYIAKYQLSVPKIKEDEKELIPDV